MSNASQPAAAQQQYYAPAATKTNTLAIVAIIAVWFVSLVGIIVGHIALSQIKTSGEKGHGIALAAVIVGYVALALAVVVIILAVVAGALTASAGYSTY